MNRPLVTALITSAAVAALALAGCGDTEVHVVEDAGTGDDAATTTDANGDEAFEDTTFRTTRVGIIRPRGVGGILESLINTDIEANRLHVLVQVTEFEGPWPTNFQLTGNAGTIADADDQYTWYPGVAIDRAAATIDERGFFEGVETLSIIFPALEPGADEPIQIPVSDLQLEGELFEEEGEWLVDGLLTGAILASEIEGITVDLSGGTTEPQTLAQLLGGERTMDYPVGAEGDALTGWTLEGEIQAERVTFVEP